MHTINKIFFLFIIITQFLNAIEIDLTDQERKWIKSNPTIKVQSMIDSVPYNYTQDGKPQGYALANIQLIASKVGLKVEIIQGNSWNESMELLKNGQIDIMPNMVKTKPREEHYAFTSAYTPIMNVMYVKDGAFHPKSLDDLNGKTLAVAKGFSEVPLLQKHYPNIKLHFTKNGTEAFKLLSLGKVDATSYSLGAGNKIILKNALLNIVPAFEIKEKIFQKYLHMATNKDNTILRDILEKGLNTRTDKEKNELREKWLLNQLNSSKSNSIEFTNEEKQWIQNNPEVSIALMPDFSPFSYIVNGDKVGFEHDLISLLSEKSGLTFKKQFDVWNKNLSKFKNKNIDIITSISYKKEREDFTLFTKPYYEIPIIIFTRDDFENYQNINSLKGKKVGILKDVFYANDLKKIGGLELVIFETYEEITKALVFGKIDALIQNLPNISHLIKENAYTNLKLVAELKLPDIGKEDLRFGINSDKPMLKNIIQKSLDAITSDEIAIITNKWLEVKQDKKDIGSNSYLSKEERDWIKNNPIIKVSNELDYPPFDFAIDKQPMGYSIDLLNLLAQKIGLNVEYVNGYTWSQLVEKFKKKELDLLHTLSITPERLKFGIYSDRYSRSKTHFISRSSDESINNIKQLYGKTVAVGKGWRIEEFLKNNHPQVNLHRVESLEEMLLAVSSGKADATADNNSVVKYIMKMKRIDDLQVGGWFKEMDKGDPVSFHFMAQKESPELISILNKALATVSIIELVELEQKWFGSSASGKPKNVDAIVLNREEKEYLSKKKEIKICVDPNWLPFEMIDGNGKYKGVGSDIINLISTKLDKPIILNSTNSWSETLQSFKNKKCDIIPMATKTPSRDEYMDFTKPYIEKPLVVATKEDQFFIQDSSDLKNKKVGIVKGYAFIELLKEKQPDINIVTVKNVLEGLRKVQNGEIFGFIDALPTIAYGIQKDGLVDLKIAGRLEFNVELSIASHKNEHILNSIMQKALDDIEKEQIDSIVGKWISIKVEQSFNYKTLIYIISIFLIVLIFILYRHYTVREMNKKLEKISITDALTNIYNRRYFNELFPKVINSAKRKNELVSFIIMDIDHFKQYNDTYGHQMGDDVLVKVAQAIKNSLHRADDYCFRLGGEEFGVIFKADSKKKALEFANTIRKNIESLQIEHNGNSASACVTVSMGLICNYAKEINGDDEVYKEGDDLLYKAKGSGRNRVCFS